MKLKVLRWGRLSWITHVDLMLSQVFSEADRERFDVRRGKRQCGRRSTGQGKVMWCGTPSQAAATASWLAKPKKGLPPNLQRNLQISKEGADTFMLALLRLILGTSLEVQWLRLHLPVWGRCQFSPWSGSLNPTCLKTKKPKRERPKHQKVKQKQYCNKIKTLNGPHPKKSLKRKKKRLILDFRPSEL